MPHANPPHRGAPSRRDLCEAGGSFSGSGGSESYTFAPDGRFEYAQFLQTTLYECRTVIFLFVRGTATVKGNQITMTATYAHNQKRATCEDSFDQDLDVAPSTYTFRVEKGRQLFMTGKDSGTTTGPYTLTK
jgi:hypothetical protein